MLFSLQNNYNRSYIIKKYKLCKTSLHKVCGWWVLIFPEKFPTLVLTL